MKNKTLLCFITIFSSLVISKSVLANNSANLVSDKQLIKCHVELLGGKRTIHKQTVTEEQLVNFSKYLTGNKIRAVGVEGYSVIHKVLECVPEDKKFKAGSARYLEEFIAK